jgi:serine/threonine protein phosphatase PrpC
VSSAQDPDVASATAAERALLAFEQTHRNGHATGEADVEAALTTAQESVASLPRGTVNAPATTIVIAVYTQGRAIIGWRGDSRAYWIGEDGATALTTDHSWLNEVIKSAEMTEAEAQNSPNAHAITNWLGADAPPELPASVQAFTPAGPGELLLCSDGLWNYASDPAILFELTRAVEGDALAVCRRLVEFARSKGGNDNITVAVLSVDGPAA